VIDLLAATSDLTQTGTSQTDFILLSVDIPEPALPGDYNQNGVVDAADYVVWRSTLGERGLSLAADGNGNNEIDTGDYDVWRAHFGQTAGSAGADASAGVAAEPPSTAVPEPSAICLCAVVAAALTVVRCGRPGRGKNPAYRGVRYS
jgi:hypothetical protein